LVEGLAFVPSGFFVLDVGWLMAFHYASLWVLGAIFGASVSGGQEREVVNCGKSQQENETRRLRWLVMASLEMSNHVSLCRSLTVSTCNLMALESSNESQSQYEHNEHIRRTRRILILADKVSIPPCCLYLSTIERMPPA
jgi:hypothetical protein